MQTSILNDEGVWAEFKTAFIQVEASRLVLLAIEKALVENKSVMAPNASSFASQAKNNPRTAAQQSVTAFPVAAFLA